jgi:glucose/arabinose dehydrogenase/photosystem II stability/assembly factor-like uncharacterized protein
MKLRTPINKVFSLLLILLLSLVSLASRSHLFSPKKGFDSIQPGKFDLITETIGWVLSGQNLFWTSDAGQTWDGIGPLIPVEAKVQDVKFLDPDQGWILWTTVNHDGTANFTLAHTSDHGTNWSMHDLVLFEPGEVAAHFERAGMGWFDAQTGWIAVKQATGSNFSLGTLFTTSDGGVTWTRSNPPVADEVAFSDPQIGWAVGGPAGDKIFQTQDGGITWRDVRPTSPAGAAVTTYAPRLSNGQGILVTTSLGGGSNLNVYNYEDATSQWALSHQSALNVEPGAIGLSILDPQNFVAVIPGTTSILRMENGMVGKFENADGLSASIVELDMVSLVTGWAKSVESDCVTASSPDGESDSVSCTSITRLLQTTDGGLNWTEVQLPFIEENSSRQSTSEGASPAIQSAESTVFTYPNFGSTEIFIGQGFDKCEIPTLSQLQTWWDSSPYKVVNLYIGGSNRACSNNALTASYINQLHQQGWKFIPTWVGPQAPCTGYISKMSSDPAAAYDQGVNEANLAVERLSELGLTYTDNTGSVVYYDIEYYGTNSACRQVVNAFMNGWVSQIRARGNLAGVYGSTLCDTGLSDLRTIANVPDVIWPARWYNNPGEGYYDPNASVWNLGDCLPNTVWANHQRIRQYEGDHDETWGALTLGIDSNVLDGVVAVPPALEPSRISFQEVAGGLGSPVFIAHAGDGSGRLFIVERGGRIRVVKNGSLLSTPFLDIQSLVKSSAGEQGLLALAFHPSYETNGKFYVVYTAPRPNDSVGSILTLRQYSVSTGNPDLANSASGTTILTIDHPTYSNHNGGTLAFGNDGYLYWSTGDGGGSGDPFNNAQNLTSLLGKILRLDVDSASPYTIPASNPFVSNPNPNTKLIWAYGLRNPWRMSFDRFTHDLYIGDVGQGVREEIDFQPASSTGGENYGWRVMEGSLCYNPSSGCDQSGKVLPVAEYDHTLGCSVTGGYVYRGSTFPSLYGYYLYGDFCSGRIWVVNNTSSGWSTPLQLADTTFNITTFGEDEQGEMYLADYATGKIHKILYQEPTFTISGNAGAAGVVLSYTDGAAKIVKSQTDGSYSFQVTSNWSGTVTPSHTCYTFTPASRTYANVTANQLNENYTAIIDHASGCAEIDVSISGNPMGKYTLESEVSMVQSYPGINGGPVVVKNTTGAPIIASYLQYRRPGSSGGWTGITQTMALTDAQISDRYVFPHYDYTDPTRYNSLQLANFDAIPTDIIVEIGGVQQGSSIPLGVGESQNVTFSGVKGGPIVVYSDNGAAIVATLYELKRPSTSSSWTGQTTMMGLPWSQLSDTYVIPRYNYTLLDLLPFVVFANTDSVPTTVTVTIGGVLRGTYNLDSGESRVESYPGCQRRTGGRAERQRRTDHRLLPAIPTPRLQRRLDRHHTDHGAHRCTDLRPLCLPTLRLHRPHPLQLPPTGQLRCHPHGHHRRDRRRPAGQQHPPGRGGKPERHLLRREGRSDRGLQ